MLNKILHLYFSIKTNVCGYAVKNDGLRRDEMTQYNDTRKVSDMLIHHINMGRRDVHSALSPLHLHKRSWAAVIP